MSVVMPRVMTRGVVFVHSAPLALCPHINWALEGVLDTRVSLDWVPQPVESGLVRTEAVFAQWTAEQPAGAMAHGDRVRAYYATRYGRGEAEVEEIIFLSV